MGVLLYYELKTCVFEKSILHFKNVLREKERKK
jgi:hypothetical protein